MKKKVISIYSTTFNQSTKFWITRIRKVLTLKNGRHFTDAGWWKTQMKVPQKRKLPFGGKMQREDSDLDYLLLLSIADCYSRGKPLPNASFLFEECKIKDWCSLLDISCFKHRIRLIGWAIKYRAVAQR